MGKSYPLTEAFFNELKNRKFKFLSGEIERLQDEFGDDFLEYAENVLHFSRKMDGKPCDSLLIFTVRYLREQVAFMASGKYSNDDFDAVYEKVYNNPDVMNKFYLEGLMLSYAFWYIPFLTQRFFINKFLPEVETDSFGCEFGFGHGLYLLEVLQTVPGSTTRSYDISPFAVEYTSRLFDVAGIDKKRYLLEIGDVRDRFAFNDGELDWAVMAEIIEHVKDPLHTLKEMSRCLKKSGVAFVSTVVDTNHIDHIYLFESPQEIRDMIDKAGMEIIDGVEYLATEIIEGSEDISNRVSLICRKA